MTTIHRIETLSSNQADYLPRYVGNAPEDVLRVLREAMHAPVPFVRDIREVDVIPADLVSPRGALDLIADAETMGLMWDVSGRVGAWAEGPWVDLTVYQRGEVAPLPVLFTVSWCAGRVRANAADKRVSLAEASRRLAATN